MLASYGFQPADETAIVYNGHQQPVSSDAWNHSRQTEDSDEHKEMKIGEVQTYLDAKVSCMLAPHSKSQIFCSEDSQVHLILKLISSIP